MTSSSASRKAKIQAAAPKGGIRNGKSGKGGGANRIVVATVVVVLVLAAVITAVILGSRDKTEATTSGGATLPKNVAAMGAGLVVNPDAPANVPTLDLYEDFQCPVCARFEDIFGLQIVDLVKANQVKLVAHPLSFLDDNLRNDSSNRAANAASCAADADKFLQYHAATFQGQPKNEGTGYSDAQLKTFATQAGHHRRRPHHLGAVLLGQVAQPVGRVGADPVREGRRQRHPDRQAQRQDARPRRPRPDRTRLAAAAVKAATK